MLRIRRLALTLAAAAALAILSDGVAGGISDETCPTIRGEHTNTCPTGTAGTRYTIRFAETEGSGCGPGRQTFHFDSGLLPLGLILAPDGTLSGTPTLVGRFQFYVEMREPQDDPANCAGKRTQKQFTLNVRRPPWILSTVTPRSEVGVPFRMNLQARGGSGTFAWVLAGGKLPRGVRLGVDGAIAGTPAKAGSYHFEVRARDTEARVVTRRAVLLVAPRLRLPSRRLPVGRVDRPYSVELTATGGVAPTVWRLTRGRLPRGIRLASALGRLAGTPQTAGRHTFTVEASDGLDVKSARSFTIVTRGFPRRRALATPPTNRSRGMGPPGLRLAC